MIVLLVLGTNLMFPSLLVLCHFATSNLQPAGCTLTNGHEQQLPWAHNAEQAVNVLEHFQEDLAFGRGGRLRGGNQS